ncbi:MAG: SGNH/GDSL hydrolase family protein [Candidatus Pacebacteria bacterium]|nr:SGNH/GDSL hydrolase family protein [Candidatus Paceibacterota bacterium]
MKKAYLLILILNICSSFFISKLILLNNNNLQNNGNWVVEKTNLEMGVMGSYNFFSNTQPLNRDHLNLGSWHGFQEIHTKNEYDFNRVEYDIRVSSSGYLINYLMNNKGERIGFKIKKNENECIKIDKGGKFIEREPVSLTLDEENKWVHISLNIKENNLSVNINGNIFSCNFENKSFEKIGFKNGFSDVYLDNIEIFKDNKKLLSEDFSNTNHSVITFLKVLLCFILVNVSIFFIFKILIKNKKRLLFLLISLNLSALISIGLIFHYFNYKFLGNYPNLSSTINNLKKQEQVWVNNEVQTISDEIMEKNINDNRDKIMFIGSSQTWGAGASQYNKSFTKVFEKLINEQNTNSDSTVSAEIDKRILGIEIKKDINVINTGISGTISSELLSEYKNQWINLNPKIVLINLSSNDFTYQVNQNAYEKNIRKFIEINKKESIETVLIIEANSKEYEMDNYLHDILKDISVEENILLIDMNKYLEEIDSQGIIWWDFVHPTDYGHELIAKKLVEEINMISAYNNNE